MPNELAPSRLRLVTERESDRVPPPTKPTAATPQVMIISLAQTQLSAVNEFAFELARALAAQTARSGAVVFAARAGTPRMHWRASRSSSRGPLSGMRLQPHLEREGVMFFEPSRIEAVSPVTRGQMPQVAVLPDQLSAGGMGFDATALVVMTQSDARPEYVELLRGELAATETRPVHVVQLTAARPGPRFARRGISVFRTQAWELAAELVLA